MIGESNALAELRRLKEKVEVLTGERGPGQKAAVLRGQLSGVVSQSVTASRFPGSGGASLAETFETVNKNLSALDATLAWSGGNLMSITYASGIVKTFAYSGADLITITLSGPTPGGIALTKTLSYTGSDLTGINYS